MKYKRKLDIILSVAAIYTAIFSFFCLALDFVEFPKNSEYDMVLFDYNKTIDDGILNNANLGSWPASRVFLFISMACLLTLTILMVVRFLYNNKIMSLITMITSALTMIMILVFVITFVSGMKTTINYMMLTMKFQAGLAIWLMAISTFVTCIMSGITAREIFFWRKKTVA